MCPDNFDDTDDSDDPERWDESEHPDEQNESEHPDERWETDESDTESTPDSSKSSRSESRGGRDEESRIRARPGVGLRAGLREFLNLLQSLDEAEERRGTGRVRGGRSRIDYDVSIGTGFGIEDLQDRPDRRLGRPRGDRPRHRSRREPRPEGESEVESGYHVTTREEEDGVVVIADLPGVGADELTVGFERHGETLIVAVEDEPVGQVSLPWPAKAEWSSFNNGVLEVHLREEK